MNGGEERASDYLNLFAVGQNCWQVAGSARASILIDGEAYFSALKSVLDKAQRRIVIIAWDFDHETLLRPTAPPDRRLVLGNYLVSLVEKRPELQIYVLVWWGSIYYGANRNLPIGFGTEWWSHPRIHFRLDDHHPIGASQHQKIVSIDDRLAFVGGMDLTQGRWDDTDHLPSNPNRCDTLTIPYSPTHDVQILIDGAAAQAIAMLAAERWRLATGEILKPLTTGTVQWPSRIRSDFSDVTIAIARSQPAIGEQPEVREIESMNESILRDARDIIYIEQQYFTIPSIGEIICEHLNNPEGPEIVLVINDVASGWIERQAMFRTRDRLFARLRSADLYRRLLLVTPAIRRQRTCKIKVHSKLIIVDGRYLKIGSSNLNQRSLGLDTECDLIFREDVLVKEGPIIDLLHKLLAEHLGVDHHHVSQTVDEHGSYLRAVAALNDRKRCLMAFPEGSSDIVEGDGTNFRMENSIVDPPRPIDLDYLFGWIGSRLRQ